MGWSLFGPEGVEMVGLLSQDETEALLRRRRIGRICCCVDERPYVVPVNYAYDGSAVYVLSAPGRKIDAMRGQPQVCFEVEEIDESGGAVGWRSVIADGIYTELTDDGERRVALTLLGKICPESATCMPVIPLGMIIFRIDLIEKAGRFGRE
jgi:nitroimidazol reductase NimA-like FMN-containing flavoprotein (pyridoxamine 5'-phosphate oxidase superfamily)